LRRSADAPASPFVPRLADRLATAQRSRLHLTGLCSSLRGVIDRSRAAPDAAFLKAFAFLRRSLTRRAVKARNFCAVA
jgi:hypothetical protein